MIPRSNEWCSLQSREANPPATDPHILEPTHHGRFGLPAPPLLRMKPALNTHEKALVGTGVQQSLRQPKHQGAAEKELCELIGRR